MTTVNAFQWLNNIFSFRPSAWFEIGSMNPLHLRSVAYSSVILPFCPQNSSGFSTQLHCHIILTINIIILLLFTNNQTYFTVLGYTGQGQYAIHCKRLHFLTENDIWNILLSVWPFPLASHSNIFVGNPFKHILTMRIFGEM